MGKLTTKFLQRSFAFSVVKRYPRGGGCFLSDSTTTLVDLVDAIRRGLYSDLDKSHLPGIVLNQFHGTRRYVDLKHLTGWWAFDVDKCIDYSQAQWIKEQIFNVPQIKVAFISNSGLGVKAIGYWADTPRFNESKLRSIHFCDVEKEKVKRYYQSLCDGLGPFGIMSPTFDKAQGVVTQPIWFSSDKHIISKL